jgi:hypothetical protein
MFTATLDGALYRCPAGKDRPLHRVLDCGTGTGDWAIDFGIHHPVDVEFEKEFRCVADHFCALGIADENPEVEVVGNDLSPIQPDLYASP